VNKNALGSAKGDEARAAGDPSPKSMKKSAETQLRKCIRTGLPLVSFVSDEELEDFSNFAPQTDLLYYCRQMMALWVGEWHFLDGGISSHNGYG
jgi:hypothetical protein